MKNEFFLTSKKQMAVKGTASVLIDSLAPFTGEVDTFATDGEYVVVIAKQQFDAKRSASLHCEFKADITNGKHNYEEGSGLRISYMLFEEVELGTKFTPYPAVYGSGTLDVTFDLVKGTLALGFDLDVQNNPTEPRLNAKGAFRDVSDLDHLKK